MFVMTMIIWHFSDHSLLTFPFFFLPNFLVILYLTGPYHLHRFFDLSAHIKFFLTAHCHKVLHATLLELLNLPSNFFRSDLELLKVTHEVPSRADSQDKFTFTIFRLLLLDVYYVDPSFQFQHHFV